VHSRDFLTPPPMRSLRRLATCCPELARVGEGLPRNCAAPALPRGSVLSRILAPVLRAQLEPDIVSTVPPPLSCSTSLLQALEVRPRLKQVRPLPCFPPLCCVSALPRVRA